MARTPEAALQTFNIGVPTRLVNGYVQECTFVAADTVYGMSASRAANYAVAGVPVDLTDTAAGPPPNQPSALVTPIGAAIRDGNTGVYIANGQTVFSIALKNGQIYTPSLLLPGTLYGITKDTTSTFWFLDTTTTGGNSAIANLVGYDQSSPNDGVNGTRVFFTVAANRRFIQ